MLNAHLYHVKLPMQVPFGHLAATRHVSDSVVLRLNIEGSIGLGECAPRLYVTGETSNGVCQGLLDLAMPRILTLLCSASAEELLDDLNRQGFEQTFKIFGTNNLICLLEIAVLDWLGQRLQLPADRLLPSRMLNTDNGLIRVSQVLDHSLSVEEFIATRGPFHFIKIKGYLDRNKDIETVRTLRQYVGAAVPILIDANMNWQFDDALTHLKALRDAGTDFVEEPLAKGSWHHLGELRRRTGMPIMLDESVCTLHDARVATHGHYCDAINVRVAKCGGLLNAIQIIELVRECGLAFQIGVQVAECGPLINAGRALAVNNPDAITVEGGQSDRFFNRMIVHPSLSIDRNLNVFSKPTGFGFGLEVTNEIEQFEVYNFCQTDNKWRPNLLPHIKGALN